MVVGQEEGLTEEQQAMIQDFVGMVRRGEIPMDQGGLGATNGGSRDKMYHLIQSIHKHEYCCVPILCERVLNFKCVV